MEKRTQKLIAGMASSLLLLTGCIDKGSESTEDRMEDKAKIETDGTGLPPKQPTLSSEDLQRHLEERDALRNLGVRTPGASLPKSAAAVAVQLVPKDMDIACDELVSLHMDDEDKDNANSFWLNKTNYSKQTGHIGGLAHPSGYKGRAGGNTTISVCKETIEALPPIKYDYVVMAGSAICPANSKMFRRYFDNEDNDNHNWSDAGMSPNFAIDHFSEINFCFVPADPNSSVEYPVITFSSGKNTVDHFMIFAENHNYEWSGSFGTDDEDVDNNNSFYNVNLAPPAEFERFQKIIKGVNGGRNTQMLYATMGAKPQLSFGPGSCGSQPKPPKCSSSDTTPKCRMEWSLYAVNLSEYQDCVK